MSETPRRVEVAGVPAYELGSHGRPFVLVAGPPVGAAIFRHIQQRLAPHRSVAVELLASGAGSLHQLTECLDAVIRETDARAVFAHGLAVPIALQVGAEHVVVSNGPVTRVDPVVRGLARMGAGLIARSVLRPGFATRWLSSSGGLRRTVVNPYVMDRDIVVMLTQAVLESAASRRTAAAWMAQLPGTVPLVSPKAKAISAIWGDYDPLYPLSEAQALVGDGALSVIPGWRHFHPEERPWESADRLVELTTT